MAQLLYRLGRASARRAWLVVITWVVIVAAAGTGFLVFGGTLASTFSIPGTAAQNVADQLQKTFPDADRGTGQLVLTSTDGQAFTADQQSQVTALLTRVDAVDGVNTTVNPFDTQTTRDAQLQKLNDAATQVSTGETQLAQSQSTLDAAKAQLTASGAPASALAQLATQQSALDQAKTTLDAQQSQVSDGLRLAAAASSIGTLSSDKTIAIATVVFDDAQRAVTPDVKTAVMAAADDTPLTGVDVNFSSEIAASTPSLAGPSEVIGLVIAAVVLFVMLGTLLAAGLPLISALIGLAVGAAGSLAFSSVVEMSSVTPALGAMVGLAVGIDYSLFILNRHRQQLKRGMGVAESIGLANGTSGNAVLFAGLTVIIALAALNITGIGFLGLMGTVGAVCVATAVLVALTLTPALISLAGMRVLNKRDRAAVSSARAATAALSSATAPDAQPSASAPASASARGHHAPTHAAPAHPVGEHALRKRALATRHPVLILLAGVIALLVVAIPATTMRLGLPDGLSEAQDSTQYKAYTAIADGFGAGANGAIIVVANLPAVTDAAALTALEANVADTLLTVPNTVAAAASAVSTDNRTAIFQVVPTDGPSAASTEQVVKDLRGIAGNLQSELDVSIGVTGLTASNIDISQKLADVMPLYLAVILVLSIILLVIVFRSIAVPLIATGGFLLTVAATFGVVTAVFQWGWASAVFGVHDPGPILSFLPTILIGVVFGLAMDYQLFLVSGMREAFVHGNSARASITVGLRAGRPVVIAAAIIMISVFGGFAFSESTLIRPIGLGLGSGVLIDAFVVRLLLVPAAMQLLGEKAWWIPRWLDRLLPDVDVEGAALERAHPAALPPAAEPKALVTTP